MRTTWFEQFGRQLRFPIRVDETHHASAVSTTARTHARAVERQTSAHQFNGPVLIFSMMDERLRWLVVPFQTWARRCLAGCFVVGLLLAANGDADGDSSASSPTVPVLKAQEVRRFSAPEAFQGVAVDADAFYAIADDRITKYDKATGRRSATWADRSGSVVHLNSCTIRNALLFCAHSNYPDRPPRSSIEIFDAATLNHVGHRSLGATPGALTWADWYDGGWWLCFAIYGGFSPHEAGPSTTVVEYDEQWRRRRTWHFPASILGAFGTMSASGGAWGPDGYLYVMGHDRPELYVLRLPESGSVLRHVATIVTPGPGQAFGWDPIEPDTLYSIDRMLRQVIVATVPSVRTVRKEIGRDTW